jgi:hypothetical protein
LTNVPSNSNHSLHFPITAKVLLCVFSLALLSGCAEHYDIILTNGSRITNVTKPVLDKDKGVFTYKDVAGGEHHVNAGRVVDIGPHSKQNDVPDPVK